MFKPDNDKIKSIIFHLLKKPALSAQFGSDYVHDVIFWNLSGAPWSYYCGIHYPVKHDNAWSIKVVINNYNSTNTTIELTEREAMEIKWQLDDIKDALEEKMWNDLADFALEEKGLQDDLLDN